MALFGLRCGISPCSNRQGRDSLHASIWESETFPDKIGFIVAQFDDAVAELQITISAAQPITHYFSRGEYLAKNLSGLLDPFVELSGSLFIHAVVGGTYGFAADDV